MQLIVDNVGKSFGIHEIFKQVSFLLDKGDKVGLVGVNGSGKTTLLKCLLGEEEIDKGVIKFAPSLRIGYVEQNFTKLGTNSLWEFMLTSCVDIIALRNKLALVERKLALATGSEREALLEDYGRYTARYEHMDGYMYEQNIKRVLMGLGFSEESWNKSAAEFSGGQKTRIMLAAALVNAPELLILDEPTNHLDIRMTEWLEGYLSEFKGGVLVVSHDRQFLDNVTNRILEMEAGSLQGFKGNYSRYLEQKEIQIATLEAAYEAQQEYIVRTENYIRRFKAGIKSKMARGRQSQLDRLERMDAPVHNEEFELSLPKASECAQKVLIFDEVTVGYEAPLVKNISLEIVRGEKVALLGANGSGKSTLLKTILQELEALNGTIKVGNRVKIGYFSQSYERLNNDNTILDDFLEEYGYTDGETRKLLGGMLFKGEEVFQKIGELSGGQKARLVLLKLVLDGANLLLLDEPTNHLDIAAKEAVEAALTLYNGTILLVSHDRYLVREIADRILEIDNGKLQDYKGGYEYYLEKRIVTDATPVVKKTVQEETTTVVAPVSSVEVKKEKKRYSASEAERLLPKVELQIREQEAMAKLVEMKMADPNNHSDMEHSAALAAEYEEYRVKTEELMAKWEVIMECLEDE